MTVLQFPMKQSATERGAADAWYARPPAPHRWDAKGKRIEALSDEEREAYLHSYETSPYGEKDWT